MSLLLHNATPGFSVTMHHKVSELVGDVEALPVIVTLDRVEYDCRPVGGCERVGVNCGCSGWAEHDEHAVGFEQSYLVTGGPSI